MSQPYTNKQGRVFDYQLLKRILLLATPYKKQFAMAGMFTVLLAIVSPLRPWLIQQTVDRDILGGNWQGLVNMTIIIFAVLLVEVFLRFFNIYLTSWLGQHVIKDLRTRVFDHVVNLKLRYFDTTPIGTVTTRTINDVETINDIFSNGIITILGDILILLAVIIAMFVTDWRMALVSLITLPIMIFATYIFKEKIKSAFQKVRNQVTKQNAFLQEHITGMSIVQIFNAQEREMKKFMRINNDHKKAHLQSVLYYSIFFPVVEVLSGAAIALMVWWGAKSVMSGVASIGTIMAFILYIGMLFRPLRMLADRFNTLQMGMVAGERVFYLLDHESTKENDGQFVTKNINGHIEFKDVSFAYVHEHYVLNNINFEVPAGQSLAIVGATGAGKSTIINLLGRLYNINKGEICIDGKNIIDFDLFNLRSKIGIVLQDVFLFSGSVLDNITLRNTDISKEQVIQAAKEIGAHEFIEKLPGSYDFNVMERGATLSMGQRQIISFIRVMVYNPQILILDEATSSIDTATEMLIQRATEKLLENRTSIIIAHRLSTIQHADQIMVLETGSILEKGNHQELLAQNGHYRRLYDMQFRKGLAS